MNLTKKMTAAIASIVTVFAMTACSPTPEKPPAEELKSIVNELTQRGFITPSWEEGRHTFTVGLGTCRFPIRKGHDDWTIIVPSDDGASSKEVRHANPALLRSYTPIKECFAESS